MPYKRCKFGCDRSVMKGTLQENKVPSRDFHETPYIVPKPYSLIKSKFGCDRSVMNGTLLGEKSTFSTVPRIPFQKISRNARFCTNRGCPTKLLEFSCNRLIMKRTLLREQSASQMYLVFHSRDFPETPQLALYSHAIQMC
jgi:hypothetical protein